MLLFSERQLLIIDAYFVCIQECGVSKTITMQMIADKVGIRRQNIYKKHFPNLAAITRASYEMVDFYINRQLQDYQPRKDGSLVDYFAQTVLPLIWAQRYYLKILYTSPSNNDWINYLSNRYTPLIQAHLTNQSQSHGLSSRFLAVLIEKQINSVIATWLTATEPEPVSLFEKRFLFLMHTPITALIK
ncbi:putative transcriptional regulator [Weissella oryzae SG25]|uniref:Putative transcriptional regulator n=2 Tax=Weissella TaxID=46255 RepID=A0A069CRL6_WEIOS|nr:putative transcriptional regulator [Weissella oryzae SG25]